MKASTPGLFLWGLFLVDFASGVQGNRQGGLLQPSGGGSDGAAGSRPSPPPQQAGPSRGTGSSGQSLLQPFSGNVYNSYTGSSSSSGSSQSSGSKVDHSIVFQNAGSRPQSSQNSPGTSLIKPALTRSSLNSGSSGLLGQSAPSSNSDTSGFLGQSAPSSNSGSSGLLGQSGPAGDRRPLPTSTSSSQSVPAGSAGVSSSLLGQKPPSSESRPPRNSSAIGLNLAGFGPNKSRKSSENHAMSLAVSGYLVWASVLFPVMSLALTSLNYQK